MCHLFLLSPSTIIRDVTILHHATAGAATSLALNPSARASSSTPPSLASMTRSPPCRLPSGLQAGPVTCSISTPATRTSRRPSRPHDSHGPGDLLSTLSICAAAPPTAGSRSRRRASAPYTNCAAVHPRSSRHASLHAASLTLSSALRLEWSLK